MSRFVRGADRRQQILIPECLDDYGVEDNPVRVVGVFVDKLDLKGLGFEGMTPAATGRPALSSGHAAEALCLWLPEQGAIQLAAGARSAAQRRADVVAVSLTLRCSTLKAAGHWWEKTFYEAAIV